MKARISAGREAETDNEVAMKLEHHSVAPSLLEEEERIYQSLARKPGFPQVYWHGHQDDFTILVSSCSGPTWKTYSDTVVINSR